MKINFIVALLAISSLVSCTSTTETSQLSGAPAEINNKLDAGEKLTDEELKELAGTADFTALQLREAARNLGYRCTFFAVTGTHIKQKYCTTQQQRDVRAAAAKTYVRNIVSANTPPLGSNASKINDL
jgi:hypothetical protein